MTLKEFSERVANYCDETEIENEDNFYTVLGGVLFEIAQRFPEVASVKLDPSVYSQTTVNMRKIVSDFASFSFPPLRVNGVYLPDGCASFDTRLGEIIFHEAVSGMVEVMYHRAARRMTRDDAEEGVEIPLSDELVELAVLLAVYRLLVIDEDEKADYVKKIYDEAAMRIEAARHGVYAGHRIVDGWS